MPKDLSTIFQAAKESRKNDPWISAVSEEKKKKPQVTSELGPSAREARAWLQKTRAEVNDKQFSVIKRVVDRALEEELDEGQQTEPLLHLMHGRPGVGKSFVYKKLREFFEQVMGWKKLVE